MIWSRHSQKRYNSTNGLDGEDPTQISINTSPPTISQANRLYFYEQITKDTVLELNKQIDEAAKQMQIVAITLELPKPPPIKLFINSRGGEVAASLCAADKIQNCPVDIHTYCEGEIASGATIISVSGKKRFMTKHAFFLIHQISSDFWGKYAEFEDEVFNLKMTMDMLREIYLTHTSIPDKELEVLLKHDLYLTPKQCLEWNFVDEII